MPFTQIQDQNPGPRPSEDFDILRQLLGGGQEFDSLSGQQLAQQPAIQGRPTGDLLGLSGHARQGGNMDLVRTIRELVEQRTPDQVARGQGPQGAKDSPRNLTTAEKQGDTIFGVPNPLKALTDALFNANNGR